MLRWDLDVGWFEIFKFFLFGGFWDFYLKGGSVTASGGILDNRSIIYAFVEAKGD